jgi:hypothetical protein
MHHLSGPLPVIGSQPTTVSPNDEPQSRGNSETGVEVQTSVESEQTCLKLPPNKEHNVIKVITKLPNSEHSFVLHVAQFSFKR